MRFGPSLLVETVRTLERRASAVLSLPEFIVVVFALLLNFPWEVLQAPFYAGMTTAPHWPASLLCARATLGDAVMTIAAYWLVALVSRDRNWIASPTRTQGLAFVAITIATYGAMEKLAIATGRWAYETAMAIVPLVHVGLSPIIQGAILAPLTVWFVRRQMNRAGGA